jgi:hypothetical protein
MNNNDVRKLAFKLFILSLLLISLAFVKGGMTRNQGNNHPVANTGALQVPVRVRQLPEDGGTLPVQLVCKEAQLTSPNELNGFSCKLINDTNKAITAVSAAYTIIIEKPDGKGTSDTGFLTLDTAIHPDFKAKKPILPRESYPVEKIERTSYDGGVIRGVVLSIDYVEFEDKTTLGPDRNGSQAITSGREGAAKFKEWLVKMYKQEGKSVEAISALLSGEEYPSELGLDDPGLRRGADYYRTRLRAAQADRGNAEIKRLLDQ